MYIGKSKNANCKSVEDTRMAISNKHAMTDSEIAQYYNISIEEAIQHRKISELVLGFFRRVKDKTTTTLDNEWYKLCRNQFRKTKDIFSEDESFMLCIRGMMNLNEFTMENIKQIIRFTHSREIKRLRATNNPLFVSKRPLTHINKFTTLFSLLDDLDEARLLIDYCITNKHKAYAKLYSLAITNKDFDEMCVELDVSWDYFRKLVKKATRYAEDYHRRRKHEKNMSQINKS